MNKENDYQNSSDSKYKEIFIIQYEYFFCVFILKISYPVSLNGDGGSSPRSDCDGLRVDSHRGGGYRRGGQGHLHPCLGHWQRRHYVLVET